MKTYLKVLSDTPTFTQNGLRGFQFPLDAAHYEFYFVDSSKGHDDFVVAEQITHTYYILEGTGRFDVGGECIPVSPGSVLEIPPQTEFSYSGTMKLLLLMSPPFAEGTVKTTRSNPEVG